LKPKPAIAKLGVTLPNNELCVLKGEPRIILKALVQCLNDEGLVVNNLTRVDMMAFALADASEEEATAYKRASVEPRIYTLAQTFAALEARPAEQFTDCMVMGQVVFLKALKEFLGKGEIRGGRLMLGQTMTVLQVARMIKDCVEEAIERADNPPEEEAEEDEIETEHEGQEEAAGSDDFSSWNRDVEEEEQRACTSNGSCAAWIKKFCKADFNKLVKKDKNFYLQEWIAEKGLSNGNARKIFSKMDKTIAVDDWAVAMARALREDGVELRDDEVDKAGLWGFRRFVGQTKVYNHRGKRLITKTV